MFIILALLHAIPPFLGALLFKEKGLLYGSIISIICAIFFGAIVFTMLDLLGTGLGIILGYSSLKSNNQLSITSFLTKIFTALSDFLNYVFELIRRVSIGAVLLFFIGCVIAGIYLEFTETSNETSWQQKKSVIDSHSISQLEQSCNSGVAEDCLLLGMKYPEKLYRNINAIKAFDRACDLGSGEGCSRVGDFFEMNDDFTYKSQTDRKIAASYFDKACLLNDPGGCSRIASYYEQGIVGYPKDLHKALLYFEKAASLSKKSHYYSGDIRRVEKKLKGLYR